MRSNYFQIHISKINHWTFLQNKTGKRKQIKALWKWLVLILKLACNRRFVQGGWRPSKRTLPKNRNYTTCVKERNIYVKQSHWVPTLLLPLYLQAPHHFAAWSKVDQIDWRRLSLIVDTEVWLRDDPTRHSVTLRSLTFSWTSLLGFQSTGIRFFAQVSLSSFRLAGCTIFF